MLAEQSVKGVSELKLVADIQPVLPR
jgi:hypothetical protein